MKPGNHTSDYFINYDKTLHGSVALPLAVAGWHELLTHGYTNPYEFLLNWD